MRATSSLTKELFLKVREFLSQDNLADQILKYDPAKGEVALLIIDAQREFADPELGLMGTSETHAVARRIARLAPAFRKAGIPVYAIHSGNRYAKLEDVGFHMFRLMPGDTLVAKYNNSAFAGSNIRTILDRDKRKLLLVAGFNTSFCVKETVMDGLSAKFRICLLEDLIGNGDTAACLPAHDIRKMKKAGATGATAAQVLRAWEKKNGVFRPASRP